MEELKIEDPTQKKFNILIVDDSSFFRKSIQAELASNHYEVTAAQNAEKALEYLEKEKFDLAVLDVEMPDMNGFQLLKAIKESVDFKSPSNIPVVFLTATDTIENRRRGFELGAIDFLGKSALSGNITSAVDRILRPKDTCAGMNVLILDDSAVVREIIKGILNDQGMNIYEAEDAKQASELLSENVNIDFMIIDKELPQSDGLEVVKEIRQNYPNRQVPILVISGSPIKDVSVDFFNAGASDYLPKPFLKEEFLARVRSKLELYKMDKNIRVSSNKLKELNEFKDKFLSQCSHDMRNPLNVIMFSLKLLKEKGNYDEGQKKLLDMLETSSESLVKLIDSILDLRRIELTADIELTDMDLKEALIKSVESNRIYAQGKSINIELSVPDRNCMIKGNHFACERVFNNIISNAVKFSEVGATINVQANIIKNKCVVKIADTGKGLTKEKIDEILSSEVAPSEVGTKGELGTGLGLNISKSICEKHGGELYIESEVGKGTTVITTWIMH